MNAKAEAINLGFKLVQDQKSNLIHLSVDGTKAACNSRYLVWETSADSADDFSCTRCLNKLAKAGA